MTNNIGINNVSSMNFSKKNAHGVTYTTYIIIPLSIFIVLISILVGLKILITGEIVPNIKY
jgi:hypothetical protein